MLLYQTSEFTIHSKIYKRHTKIINVKYQLQHGTTNLNYLIDYILYQIFNIVFSLSLKKA